MPEGKEQVKGRCIGCRSTDWPTCGGCGADLSAECSDCHRPLGYNGGCENCVEARTQMEPADA